MTTEKTLSVKKSDLVELLCDAFCQGWTAAASSIKEASPDLSYMKTKYYEFLARVEGDSDTTRET